MACFLSQDYADRELVILDDHDCRSFPDGIEHPLIRYHCLDYLAGTGINIPMKRNRVNALANGAILAHWDSDDWSAPGRLTEQVRLLNESQKAVFGYHGMVFYDERKKMAAKYPGVPNINALGTSLIYRREFWESHPYIEKYFVGSDNQFVKAALEARQFTTADAGFMMIARCHDGNTGQKHIDKKEYIRVPLGSIPAEIREQLQII